MEHRLQRFRTVAGKLTFNWIDNTGMSNALSSDLAFVAAYNEELQHWTFIQKAAARNAGTFTLDATPVQWKTGTDLYWIYVRRS